MEATVDIDSIFPAIRSEPIDVYPLKNYFLVAYPNFLVLGQPKWSKSLLSFDENSYIKIHPCFYADWKNCFKIIESKIAKNEFYADETTIVDYPTFEVILLVKNETFFLQIHKHANNKTSIQLSLLEYNNLCNGISALFFKPFCLPTIVNFTIKCCVETRSLLQIKKINNTKEAVRFVEELDLFGNDFDKIYLAAESIIRFHSDIILQKKMYKNTSICVKQTQTDMV